MIDPETPAEDKNETEPEVEQETPQAIAERWKASVKAAEKDYEDFLKRGDRISKRYRQANDKDNPIQSGSKFNLFWSNIQTLAPATYSRRPKVDVTRRFADQDPVARVASLILERGLQYEIDCGLEFHSTMKSVVLDRLLPGRGTVWVRYEPEFRTETHKLPSETNPMGLEEQDIEVVHDEKCPVDYVYWKDFLSSQGRVWADVRWVARRVMFSKEMLKKRFGATIAKLGGNIAEVQCDYDPTKIGQPSEGRERPATQSDQASDPSLMRALVWEIWDKETKQLVWINSNTEVPLDVVDDPADLPGFFPCPEPLSSTTTNDQLIPVPDYTIYKDQLQELDQITARISLLVQGLRVIGVYDSSQAALQSMLQSGMENRMIPVDSWGAFAEKGGLKGVTDFLPLDQVITVLTGLYDSRDRLKQLVYEITGMADIIRGATSASETLGAQQIKAKFANLRLSARQQQVAEFVTLVLQIKAHLMCKNYSPETLTRISAAEQMDEVKKNPQALPAALKLLKDGSVRDYRIVIQSGSMVELDAIEEQEQRNTFMSTLANFFLAMKNIASVAPEMMLVSLEMLKFVVRGFPVGRSLEASIEDACTKIQQRLENPQKPGPSPEEIKMMIAKLQQAAETDRTKMKEEGATDREEFKGTVALELAGLDAKIDKMGMDFTRLSDQIDREHEAAQQQREHAAQAEQAQQAQAAQAQQAAQVASQQAQPGAPA